MRIHRFLHPSPPRSPACPPPYIHTPSYYIYIPPVATQRSRTCILHLQIHIVGRGKKSGAYEYEDPALLSRTGGTRKDISARIETTYWYFALAFFSFWERACMYLWFHVGYIDRCVHIISFTKSIYVHGASTSPHDANLQRPSSNPLHSRHSIDRAHERHHHTCDVCIHSYTYLVDDLGPR